VKDLWGSWRTRTWRQVDFLKVESQDSLILTTNPRLIEN
jgi:hypothetical protein